MDRDDEDRCQKMINDRIARDLATKGDIEEVRTLHTFRQAKNSIITLIPQPEPVYTELQRKDESEKGISYGFHMHSFSFALKHNFMSVLHIVRGDLLSTREVSIIATYIHTDHI